MMNKPGIVTAIPKRRYMYGEFTVVILGDIQSDDEIFYRYILAVMKGSDPQPGMYLTVEGDGPGGRDTVYNMRMIMADGAEIIGASAAWNELDEFAKEGLNIVSDVLQLSDEVPYQLM